jgi:hypothetical protein
MLAFTGLRELLICQQVTLSGDAEWPKVADAVIEAPEHTPYLAPAYGGRRSPIVHHWQRTRIISGTAVVRGGGCPRRALVPLRRKKSVDFVTIRGRTARGDLVTLHINRDG